MTTPLPRGHLIAKNNATFEEAPFVSPGGAEVLGGVPSWGQESLG